MTIRALACGLLLAVAIAAGTYFNDFVIRQTMIIATHLPVAVFGPLLVALLAAAPLLRAVGVRPLRPSEVGVIAALALAACAWPGSGFWRYTAGMVAMPAHWYRTAPSWQAQGVMSYVPGVTGKLAPGQVRDWQVFARELVAAGEAEASDSVAAALWRELGDDGQAAARAVAASSERLPSARLRLLDRVNQALEKPGLFGESAVGEGEERSPREVVAVNRAALVAAMPELVAPQPAGEGALLTQPGADPGVTDPVATGTGEDVLTAFESVPWSRWWPTLRLWVGTALALGLGMLCLSLIVHPQWSRRELLAYPISRFVEEVAQRQPDAALPAVAYRPGFWVALVGVLGIHILNGLNVWFETGVTVNLTMPFTPLTDLFPNAGRVPLSWGVFSPRIYFIVIAFAFFLPKAVSLSLGLAHPLFVAVGAFMLANGVTWEYEKMEPSKTGFLRFGAFVGMALLIAYTGRRYYANVAASAVGLRRLPETPAYATWAARGFVLATAAGVGLLISGGLAWDLALILVGLFMLSWLVMSRIVCETGSFFITNAFYPMTVFWGLLGFEAIGPTGFVLATLASWILMADPREALMPYIANGLQMVDRGGVSPGRAGRWLVVAVVASMVVAGVATITQQHQHGVLGMSNDYSARWVPSIAFDRLADQLAQAEALDTLQAAVEAQPMTRLLTVAPHEGALAWLLVGLVLVVGCAMLRLRVPWWPIHPVLFLMWGTYANACFGFSFLLGWFVKTAVVGVGGTRAYTNVKPIMIGMVSGEVLAMTVWTVVGASYYFATGHLPSTYQILPG